MRPTPPPAAAKGLAQHNLAELLTSLQGLTQSGRAPHLTTRAPPDTHYSPREAHQVLLWKMIISFHHIMKLSVLSVVD